MRAIKSANANATLNGAVPNGSNFNRSNRNGSNFNGANGGASANATAKAFGGLGGRAKYFVIALLLAVIAITSVGVSKWNIHIQQVYPNNFAYTNTKTATDTTGGESTEPILNRYLTINYTETATDTTGATTSEKTTYYLDTLTTDKNSKSQQTEFTYNAKPFTVTVSDTSYNNDDGNASAWSEWAEVGLEFSYTYYKTHDYNTSGSLTEIASPTALENTAYPTDAGKYTCVITATTTSTATTAAKKAAEQLNYLTNPFDSTKTCAAEISFTIKQRAITVTIANKESIYGNAIATLTATTSDTVANADNTTLNGDGEKLDKIVSLSAIDGNGNAISNTTNVGTYNINGNSINANYAVTFQGTTTETQSASFNDFGGETEVQSLAFRLAGTNAETDTTAPLTDETTTSTSGTYTITTRTVTITWSETTSFVYDSTAHQPTFELKNLVNGDECTTAVTASDSSTATDGQAINVGSYVLTVTLPKTSDGSYNYAWEDETGTNATAPKTKDFTITPLEIIVTIEDKSSTYGDDILELTATTTNDVANKEGLVKIVSLYTTDSNGTTTTLSTTSNAGSYKIKGNGINSNYTVTFTEGTYTINKRSITITWGNVSDRTYDGTDKFPTATPTNICGSDTITVTLVKDGITSTTAQNAGSYKATATFSSNYTTTDDTEKSFTISKRSITVTIADKESTYGNPIETLTAKVTSTLSPAIVTSDSESNIYSLATTATTTSNVGTYDITGTQKTDFPAQNYEITFKNASDASKPTGTYTINKRPVTITWSNTTLNYNGQAQKPTASADNLVSSDSVTVSGEQTNAGTYTAQATISDNYSITSPNTSFTINKVTLTATASSHTVIYGADVPQYTITYSGFVNNETASTATDFTPPTITCAYQKNSPVTADGYPVALSGGSATNYNFTYVNGKVTVTPNTVTVPTLTETFVYDGTEHTALTGYDETLVKIGGTNTATNAGNYTATATLNDATNYKWSDGDETATKSFNWAITAAPLTVKADDKNFTQGNKPDDFAFSYTVTSGTVYTDDEISVTYTVTDSSGNVIATVDNDTPSGTYTITPSAENGNYNITYETGTLKITVPLTITWVNTEFTYNGQAQAPTATATGLNDGDTLTLTITDSSGNAVTEAKNAGTYTITATFDESKYSTSSETEKTFTITARTIEVTIADKTSVYGETPVTLEATTTDEVANTDVLYNIVSLTASVTKTTNVGDYLIKGSLKDADIVNNYTVTFKGNATNETDGIYKITNATITNVVVTPYTGTYDETAHDVADSVTATTVNDQTITVEYSTDNGTTWSDTLTIKNAGSVTFSVRISAKNHNTLTLDETTATVSKATPTASITIVAEDPRATGLIEDGDTLKVSNLTLTGANNKTITYSSYTMSAKIAGYTGTSATATQTITFKITPKDTTNYNEIAVNVDITVTAVAKSDTTYYGTIESALQSVSSGEVYVLVGKNPLIRSDCEIRLGVTLYLPLDDNGTWDKTGSNGVNGSHYFAANHSYGNTSLLKATAVLSAGKTLTNNGTLNIGGTVTGGQGGYNAGFTCGEYSQLTLGENAKVDSPNGSITCYGYIVEDSLNNGSSVIMGNSSGATPTITLPFVVIEHRGGTVFCGLADNSTDLTSGKINATPFNRFLLPNVTAKLTINYGAKLEGFADLYALNKHNTTIVKLIGASDDYLLNIASGTKIVSKYNPDTNVTDLNVKGTASINSLTLKIMEGVATLSTATVYFPLSWYYNITLSKFENGSDAIVTATAQALKILPGCVVTINEGVTANMKTVFVTQDTSWTESNADATSYDGNGTTTPKAPGKLIVNGTLNVENINGVITTQSTSATLNITGSVNATSKEVKAPGSDTYWYIHTINVLTYTELGTNESAQGLIWTSATTPTENSNFSVGAYVSDGQYWCKVYDITYDLDGGTLPDGYETTAKATGTVANGVAIGELPEPAKNGYTFDYWTYNNEKVTADSVFYDSITLVANWTAVKYQITYNYVGCNEEQKSTITSNNPTEFTCEDNITFESAETSDTESGLTFVGWYLDEACETAIASISAGNYYEDLTLYGKWTTVKMQKYEVTLASGKEGVTLGTTTITVSAPEDDTKLSFGVKNGTSAITATWEEKSDSLNADFMNSTVYDTAITNEHYNFAYYFTGWKFEYTLDGTAKEQTSTESMPNFTFEKGATGLKLTAQWADKAKLQINTVDVHAEYTTTKANTNTLYFAPGMELTTAFISFIKKRCENPNTNTEQLGYYDDPTYTVLSPGSTEAVPLGDTITLGGAGETTTFTATYKIWTVKIVLKIDNNNVYNYIKGTIYNPGADWFDSGIFDYGTKVTLPYISWKDANNACTYGYQNESKRVVFKYWRHNKNSTTKCTTTQYYNTNNYIELLKDKTICTNHLDYNYMQESTNTEYKYEVKLFAYWQSLKKEDVNTTSENTASTSNALSTASVSASNTATATTNSALTLASVSESNGSNNLLLATNYITPTAVSASATNAVGGLYECAYRREGSLVQRELSASPTEGLPVMLSGMQCSRNIRASAAQGLANYIEQSFRQSSTATSLYTREANKVGILYDDTDGKAKTAVELYNRSSPPWFAKTAVAVCLLGGYLTSPARKKRTRRK